MLIDGPKVHVGNRRIHHGLVGCVLIGIGLVLCWDDLADWPWPLTRREDR